MNNAIVLQKLVSVFDFVNQNGVKEPVEETDVKPAAVTTAFHILPLDGSKVAYMASINQPMCSPRFESEI